MKRSNTHRSAPSRFAAAAVLAPVHAYRRLVSPSLSARCKYYPSCSQYAVDAVRELGVFRGLLVALWRLARCNPWSNGGVDPIENRSLFRASATKHTHDCAHTGGAAA